jgi:hypothetical protein
MRTREKSVHFYAGWPRSEARPVRVMRPGASPAPKENAQRAMKGTGKAGRYRLACSRVSIHATMTAAR